MTNVTRRTVLGGLAITAIPSIATAKPTPAPNDVGVESCLDDAGPIDRARFHAGRLTEAMAEIHGHRNWRSHIDHETFFVLVVGDPKKLAPVAEVYVDDGSPLLADDVTGSSAFAGWEASQ